MSTTNTLSIRTELEGSFRFITHGPERGTIEWPEFKNLILDVGLNLPSNEDFLTTVRVGTGTSTPLVTQASMDALLATTSNAVSNTDTFVSDASNPYWAYKVVRRFATGTAAGILAEVGIGSSSTLWSRARILDSGGNPTTITVLPTEALDVEYTLRIYIPMADVTGTRTIGGVATSYVVRAESASNGGPWSAYNFVVPGTLRGIVVSVRPAGSALGTVYTTPSGTQTYTDNLVGAVAAYSSNSYQRDITITLPTDRGNTGSGIGALTLDFLGAQFQMSFSPAIPKTPDYVATLTFRRSWARRP